jgi:erythromycin esterase-like protein
VIELIKTSQLVEIIKKHACRFNQTSVLQPLIDQAAKAKYVLLGEASHGTSEFYTIRTDITKMLIEDHHFSYIAVEGDWPSCFEVNRYIKGLAPEYKNAEDLLKKAFNRWPTWMWANKEMVQLIDWLKEHNENLKDHKKIGFYGLDVYSLWESLESIIDYLKKIESPNLDRALDAIKCFDPFHRKPEMYGISAAFHGEDCIDEVVELLHAIQFNKKLNHVDSEAELSAKINGMVVSNGEHYYHTMITNDNESWNIRDHHMVEALEHVAAYYGKDSKGIIWEHNTHIGDARATDMVIEEMVNVGQITREQFGPEQVYAVGFGTHHGTVLAASKWGDPIEVMTVPKATEGSWEDAMHLAGPYNQYILFTDEHKGLFSNQIGHRAIGVVYNPDYEHYGNYVPSRMSLRYDAFIHVDETKALSHL